MCIRLMQVWATINPTVEIGFRVKPNCAASENGIDVKKKKQLLPFLCVREEKFTSNSENKTTTT